MRLSAQMKLSAGTNLLKLFWFCVKTMLTSSTMGTNRIILAVKIGNSEQKSSATDNHKAFYLPSFK